jgi:hypothetical protein
MRAVKGFVAAWCALAAVSACGGKAIIDGGAGGGGSGGSSSSRASASTALVGPGASTSTGGTTCDAAYAAFRDALDKATACNACLDFDACAGGPVVTDECGCVVGAVIDQPEAVSTANETYKTWVDAGCGPLDCTRPCPLAMSWTCGSGDGSCDGRCVPLGG